MPNWKPCRHTVNVEICWNLHTRIFPSPTPRSFSGKRREWMGRKQIVEKGYNKWLIATTRWDFKSGTYWFMIGVRWDFLWDLRHLWFGWVVRSQRDLQAMRILIWPLPLLESEGCLLIPYQSVFAAVRCVSLKYIYIPGTYECPLFWWLWMSSKTRSIFPIKTRGPIWVPGSLKAWQYQMKSKVFRRHKTHLYLYVIYLIYRPIISIVKYIMVGKLYKR